jgi:flagellar hook-basal body complex protein FliE
MPVDAITAMGVTGPEWNISIPDTPGLDGATAVDGAGSGAADGGFGGMLTKQIENLQGLQTDAAAQSQALATGTAEDASQVVMAVEKARLSMQLAATLRDKGVESFQEIFRTQV